jgi:hypothetical protein
MFARWIGVTAAAAGGRAGYMAVGTTTATFIPEVVPAEAIGSGGSWPPSPANTADVSAVDWLPRHSPRDVSGTRRGELWEPWLRRSGRPADH